MRCSAPSCSTCSCSPRARRTPEPMIETLRHGDLLLAMILRRDFRREGIEFFTPPDYSQQLGYMNRPAGHRIRPHAHRKVQREVTRTQEVLFVRRGRVRVDFYDEDRRFLRSTELVTGDVILLADGGHGFEMLEDTE